MSSGDIEANPGPPQVQDRNLSFCHANMRSIKRRLDKLDHIRAAFSGSHDVITLSETWLSPGENLDQFDQPMYNIAGYHDPVRRDRVGRPGGGLLAWVSESLTYRRRQDIETDDIEVMALEIRHQNKKVLLLVAYRTNEQTTFWDSLQEYYNKSVLLGYNHIIIMGDLNADPSTPHGELLLSFIEANNLTKHINESTRITETSHSELDQIISNCGHMVYDIAVTPPVSYNDHHTVSGKIRFKVNHPRTYQRLMWQYGAADFDLFRYKLTDVDWRECFISDDIDVITQTWTNTLINIARECIPNKMVTVRPWDKPFYNGYLRRLRRAKDRAHHLAKYDNTTEAWEMFRRHRTYYFSEIRRLKLETHNKLLANMVQANVSNPRKWWEFYKKLLRGQHPSVPALCVDNQTISDDIDKAQAFNDYFIECSTLDESMANLPNTYPALTQDKLEDLITEECDIRRCLLKLDPKKAFGPDGVSPRLLKEGANQLAPVLNKLFNKSLSTGIYPKLWKRANVIPIHKKKDKALISNYRPVSLLSSVGKVMEKLIFYKLCAYFKGNYLISIWQSGFIPGHSTTTHLVEIYHSFCQSVSDGKEVRVVFCVVSRSFDRVWHKGLLFKLEKCGISGSLLEWLKNYLQDRYQRVVINGQLSTWKQTVAGVPQGSVLGPLLFLIFINDITYVIQHCKIRLYADDTTLFIEVDDRVRAAEQIDEDLKAMSDWANTWLVKFSPPKTESLIISNKRRLHEHPPIYMDGSVLREVTKHKHVGVTLSRNLAWHDHICDIEKRARSVLVRLSQFKYTLDRRSLERVYLSCIRPILEYADVAWAFSNQADFQKLDMIKKDAARVVTGATARCNTHSLMIDVGWPSLASRRRVHQLALFYQIVNGLSPPYLRCLLPQRVSERTRYVLRTSNHLSTPASRTNTFSRSFVPSTVVEWNKLEDHIKNIPTLASFKNRLMPKNRPTNVLFYYGPRWTNIQLARLRIGCSNLNSHLFHNLHVVNHPHLACGYIEENVEHFFFTCPMFIEQRRNLFAVLDYEASNTHNILHGITSNTPDGNRLRQDAVITYIEATGRFTH
jgi:hypothetical protein